jgi:hypothetical protein
LVSADGVTSSAKIPFRSRPELPFKGQKVLKMTKSDTDCAAFAIFNLLCMPNAYSIFDFSSGSNGLVSCDFADRP